MLRLLADENVNGDIVRGVRLRRAVIDLVRVQDLRLKGSGVAELLAFAHREHRIVLTHDRSTMPTFAIQRIAAGDGMAGGFLLNDRLPVREAIEEIVLIADCSDQAEWDGRIVYLPL